MKILGRKTVKGATTSAPMTVKATKNGKAPAAAASEAPRRAPTHEEIAMRSYQIYLARGATDGHAAEDWAQAERELSS